MIINAELKGVFTSEMDALEKFCPVEGNLFQVTIRAMIGPKNEPGAESFDFQICTPEWLAQECQQSGFVFGRHRLIVSHYDADQIRSILANLVGRVSGQSWQELALKLSQYAQWEFDNYQPYSSTDDSPL